MAEMAFSLFAVNEGYLDNVEVVKVLDYEAALHDYAKSNASELVEMINTSGDFNEEIEADMRKLCDDFAEKGAF